MDEQADYLVQAPHTLPGKVEESSVRVFVELILDVAPHDRELEELLELAAELDAHDPEVALAVGGRRLDRRGRNHDRADLLVHRPDRAERNVRVVLALLGVVREARERGVAPRAGLHLQEQRRRAQQRRERVARGLEFLRAKRREVF